MKRRSYLSGLAGLGAFSAVRGFQADAQSLAPTRATGDSYHPGPPRFMHADEKLVDPLTPDYRGDGSPDGRNVLAPGISPQRDPDGYDADAFSWSVIDTPADSEVEGFYSTPEEYDYGTDNVEEFDPDVPGVYTLELDAPDGTHQLTVRVFPEPPEHAGGPPRVHLTGSHERGTFELDANPATAPDSSTTVDELDVEFYADDRDALAHEDISVDGATATVPEDAVDGTARVHTVAIGQRGSVAETVELDAEAGEVTMRNAPPDWIENATMYEIFVRSFGTEPGEVDFSYLADRVDYLADLGIDVVWLTPIVAATSHREDNPPGGPHGYDTLNYFETADALGSLEAFDAFVETCHERDIRVCFDLVINHTDVNHRFVQDAAANGESSKYFDWYERTADGSLNNYFGWSDLVNINYQNAAMRRHILAVVDFWADHVDGFRCDIAYGVTHDFWKEVRALVRARDSDIFLLDEAIPYGSDFSEQEFDVHFDEVLFETLRDVGKGGVAATEILHAIEERKNRGVPDNTVFLQYTENHDTRRYLDVASLDAEKAAAAATFTLPGMPMVYYGAERAIAAHSEPRLDEKGHFRAFMNWEDYDEEHLEFYRRLSTAREEVEALRYDADLVGAYFQTDSEQVVAYGRDAGDQKVVVVLNFAEEPQEVELRGPVGTTNLISDSDVGVESGGETTRVAVDAVAVLETPSLSGLGTHVAGLDDETGDDHGPGSYTYPTGDAFAEGAFDLTGVDLYETESDYQLRLTVDGPVENPRGYDGGFSVQHVQCYVRDPTDSTGTHEAREGLTATLSDPYQYRIVGDGRDGARVETADGETVATGEVFASPSTHSIRLDVPKHAVPGGLQEKQLAPLVLGYDPEATGGVTAVGERAGQRSFGGADGGNAPEVIDLVTPADTSQAAALAAGEEPASIPYVVMGDPLDGEVVEQWDDATGDDHGPGSYTYPTGDAFAEGALDIESVEIQDAGDRFRFVYRLAGELTNPGDGAYGFSLQNPQVYVRNGGDASATAGREGTNVAFEKPYHYRISVTGVPGESAVEAADGSVVTRDLTVSAYPSLDAIAFSVSKSAVGGDLEGAAVAPLLCARDPDGPGGVRQVESEATETAFGGADGESAPAVIDMVAPEGTAQESALADGDSLPYLSLAGFSGTLIASWDDADGDDHGPGSYTYPGAEVLTPGTYDIDGVELYEASGRYRIVYYTNGPIDNPWSAESGFSVHNLQVYIRDPSGGSPSGEAARKGVNARFAEPYHYRAVANGYGLKTVEAADGEVVTQDLTAQAYPGMNAIAMDFPADAIEGDIREMQIVPLLLGHDGYGKGLIRTVSKEAEKWKFGGGRFDARDPNVIDLITPEGVTQAEALSYTAETQARIPFVPVTDAASGEDGTDSQNSSGDQNGSDDGADDQNDGGTTTTDGPVTTYQPDETRTPSEAATPSDTTTSVPETSAPTDDEHSTTTSGDGPGFGVLSGALGTAGGAAYAAKRLLSETSGVREIDVDDVDDAEE